MLRIGVLEARTAAKPPMLHLAGGGIGETGVPEWTPAPAATTRSTPARLPTRKGSGARPRLRSTGTSRRSKSSTRTPASTAAGSRARSATPATTRSTAMWSAAAADQAAIIYDSPVTNTKRCHHLCGAAARGRDARRRAAGLRRHQRRPRHPLHADGARGAVRHVRLRAHRRDPFASCSAGSRRKSLRPASTTASRS